MDRSWMLETKNAIKHRVRTLLHMEKAPMPNTSWMNRLEQFELFRRPSDVVMIGDSITQQGHWHDMFPHVRIANRGVGGDKTGDVIRRLDDIARLKPRKAFLMMGINDFGWGLGVDDVLANYSKIVNFLLEKEIIVYIQSTIECSKTVCGAKLRQVRSLNQKLQQLSIENKVYFINLNDELSDHENGLRDQYTFDGIHLSGAGYVVWQRSLMHLMD